MKQRTIAIVGWLLFCAITVVHAQNLDAVLNSMDQAAAGFHNAQADFAANELRQRDPQLRVFSVLPWRGQRPSPKL